MTNKYLPHLMVLPEDDANRQLAGGFVLGVRHDRRIRVLPEAGGWSVVLDRFLSDYVSEMRKYYERHMVLLLDFDERDNRPDQIRAQIPDDLTDRVFILGVQSEPEALKRAGLGSLEHIGARLAIECREGKREIWAHDLLKINASELDRLQQVVRGFLF
jgi:hypothetical protein